MERRLDCVTPEMSMPFSCNVPSTTHNSIPSHMCGISPWVCIFIHAMQPIIIIFVELKRAHFVRFENLETMLCCLSFRNFLTIFAIHGTASASSLVGAGDKNVLRNISKLSQCSWWSCVKWPQRRRPMPRDANLISRICSSMQSLHCLFDIVQTETGPMILPTIMESLYWFDLNAITTINLLRRNLYAPTNWKQMKFSKQILRSMASKMTASHIHLLSLCVNRRIVYWVCCSSSQNRWNHLGCVHWIMRQIRWCIYFPLVRGMRVKLNKQNHNMLMQTTLRSYVNVSQRAHTHNTHTRVSACRNCRCKADREARTKSHCHTRHTTWFTLKPTCSIHSP